MVRIPTSSGPQSIRCKVCSSRPKEELQLHRELLKGGYSIKSRHCLHEQALLRVAGQTTDVPQRSHTQHPTSPATQEYTKWSVTRETGIEFQYLRRRIGSHHIETHHPTADRAEDRKPVPRLYPHYTGLAMGTHWRDHRQIPPGTDVPQTRSTSHEKLIRPRSNPPHSRP